jgi:hypothetical protein
MRATMTRAPGLRCVLDHAKTMSLRDVSSFPGCAVNHAAAGFLKPHLLNRPMSKNLR